MSFNRDFNYPLYLVTDEETSGEDLQRLIHQALLGGVSIVQVRHKNNNVRQFIERAQIVKTVIDAFNADSLVDVKQATWKNNKVPLIINDRVDVALAVEADGVHLGQSDMPVEIARRLMGNDKIVGLTVESPEQLQAAQTLDVDYVGISTIFNTATKLDTQYQWEIAGLSNAVKQSNKPLVAIGGITDTNIAEIAQTGVPSIALVSAICQAIDPTKAAQELKQLMLSHKSL